MIIPGVATKNYCLFEQSVSLLDNRGYCTRLSMCSYSLGVPNYDLTYPPKTHPSTAPYSDLTAHFKQLVKNNLLHRMILKAILYPDARNVNISKVLYRRKQNQHSNRRRRSIGSSSDLSRPESGLNEYPDGEEATSDAASSEASSADFTRYYKCKVSDREASRDSDQGTFIDHGSRFEVDCTKDIFASIERNQKRNDVAVDRDSDGSFIFMHNRKNSKKCDMDARDSLKYYSKPVRVVIERSPGNKTDSIVHTSTAQLVIADKALGGGVSESLKPGRKVSDLTEILKIDQDAQMADDLAMLNDSTSRKASPTDERHSMPTLFVGNRFNCSSLTEVYIPSYREKKEAHTIDKKIGEASDNAEIGSEDRDGRNSVASEATTHSSTIDIPAMIPAPNDMTAELLYNLDHDVAGPSSSARSTTMSGARDVIKPPSMFGNSRTSLNKEPSPFDSHALNSDKKIVMRRKSGEATPKNKRCISYHYINMHGDQRRSRLAMDDDVDGGKHTKKCECCASSRCPSPRSSDSGMAGSCTISSPDAPTKLFDQEDYETFDHEFPDEAESRLHTLMHSQSSHNFGRFNEVTFQGDNNHDSGQYGHSSLAPDEPNADINNMFELSLSRDTVKRQSRCRSAERTTEHGANVNNPNRRLIYKTGLYAHWWKKEVLPGAVLRDIHNMVHPKSPTSSSRGTSKPQRIGWDINRNRMERPQPEGVEPFSRVGWGSGKTFLSEFC